MYDPNHVPPPLTEVNTAPLHGTGSGPLLDAGRPFDFLAADLAATASSADPFTVTVNPETGNTLAVLDVVDDKDGQRAGDEALVVFPDFFPDLV